MVDCSCLRGCRILVTGSTGFKGSWLCSWLLHLGAEVSGFALEPEPDAPLFHQLHLNERIHQLYGDIRDPAVVQQAFTRLKPDAVIHLAAQALVFRSYADPKTTFDVNVGGAVNLLDAIKITKPRALVFITSDKCYQNNEWVWGYRENDQLGGIDPYSASKAAAELIFASYQQSFFHHQAGLIAATARAGNVIGGGDLSQNRIVPDCIRALRLAQPVILRRPDATRPWQHVLEPLSGYVTLLVRQLNGDSSATGAWNFGPDANNIRTVETLARVLVEDWGGGEVIVERESSILHEARLLMLNNDKAKTILGWRPRWSFEQTVKYTVDWFRHIDDGCDPIKVTAAHIAAYEDAGVNLR